MPKDTPRVTDATPASPPAPPWARPLHGVPRRSTALPLDRGRIVETALHIVDDEGVDALSIRRLASELGTSPMAVYWHVRDKAELLDLVGEAVLETIRLPSPGGEWRDELRAIHRAMLDAVLRHPNTADLMIGRARYGRAGIGMFERILSILLGIGMSPAAAFDAYQSLYLFLLGYVATASRTPAFVQAQVEGVGYLRSLDPADFPSIAVVAPVIGARSPGESFEVGLDVVIEGISALLVG